MAAAQPNSVQISSDVLTSLLSSIAQLQIHVSELRQDDIHLNSEVRQIQLGLRGRFAYRFAVFPGLAFEIRCLIWKLALNEPSTHFLGRPCQSQGYNVTKLAYRESRRQELEERLSAPWYSCNADLFINSATSHQRHYYNANVDVLYVSLLDSYKWIHIFLQQMCSPFA